jgi:hypothetical protein
MYNVSLVTTAWRVVEMWMQEKVPRCRRELLISNTGRSFILEVGWWGPTTSIIQTQHVTTSVTAYKFTLWLSSEDHSLKSDEFISAVIHILEVLGSNFYWALFLQK